MTEKRTFRVRITSPTTLTVPVGRGLIDLEPGYTGPVVPDVAAWLITHGGAEVWQDGEPPAPGQAQGPETVTAVRVVQSESGPVFTDIEPPPFDPLEDAPGELEGNE